MHIYNVALIGFGGVNRALAELTLEDPNRWHALGFRLQVVAITDLMLGTVIDAGGVDVDAALRIPRGADFSTLPGGSADADNQRAITHDAVDIVVEATFTDPTHGEPAASHVRWALEAGKHVVTTNKGPAALHGESLQALAAEHDVELRYEGAVMSGTPVIRFARQQLQGLEIVRVEGIFNGTSNYVLGRLEDGLDMDAAVAEARAAGYAEADPTADLEGSDVQLKVVIVAREILGTDVAPADVTVRGIRSLTVDDVDRARAEGLRWKLVGSVERGNDGSMIAEVRPRALPASHPLAAISGATNAITFGTDLLGEVTIAGPGAGRMETAYALLSDVIEIHHAIGGRVHV